MLEIQDYTKLNVLLGVQTISYDAIYQFKIRWYKNILIGRMSVILGVKIFYVVLENEVRYYKVSDIEWYNMIGEYYEQ